jgi:multiple sugar transport system permease protein/putative aldouronate transport system permease protein
MGFPLSILLALGLNYIGSRLFKKTVQMISYAPNFISVVVMAGILFQLFNPRFGAIGQLIGRFAGAQTDIFLSPGSFRHIYVWSGVWQGVGFSSIIYISALSAVSPEHHEAAIIDGASIPQRIWHVDLPAILPVTIVQLILSTGGLLNTGFEKVLLFQNSLNLRTSEVIDTYAYKIGLASSMPNYSSGAAIGLFKSVVCFVLLVIVNRIAKKVGEASLW